MEMIELYNEDGQKVVFKVLATFDVDGEDYAIVTPVDEADDDSVVIFRLEETEEDYLFEGVDDDEEIERVLDAYYDLIEKRS